MNAPSEDPAAPGGGYSAPGNGTRIDDDPVDEQAPTDAFRIAAQRLKELGEYVSYYLAARSDGIRLSLRSLVIYAGLGIVAVIAAGAMVVSAVALVCWGIAIGLSVLFGHVWLGYLVTGILLLGLIGGGTWFGLRRVTGASRERTVKKYANRQKQQRAQFGRDVQQAASDPAE